MSKITCRWIAALLLSAGAGLQVGCQACGTCYDYSPPVANCQCESCNCGGGRAGSRMTGYAQNESEGLEASVQVAKQPAEQGGLLTR